MYRKLIASLVLFLFITGSAWAGDLSEYMPEHVGDMAVFSCLSAMRRRMRWTGCMASRCQRGQCRGRYASPKDVAKKRPAEVWVSRVESAKEARRQTGLMVHMMYENPKSPFRNPRRIEHAGLPVYRFEGMGQAHLIWFKDDLAFWISVNPDDEAAMLQAFCK